MQVCNCKL